MNDLNEKRMQVLGAPIDDWAMEEVVKWCESAIQQRKQQVIVTLNAHSHWCAFHDARMMQVIKRADLVVPEYGMYWAAKQTGKPLSHFVLGIELMKELLQMASQKNFKIFLLGSRQAVLEALFIELNQRYPNLKMHGHNGYFKKDEEASILLEINVQKPDMLFVAMGTPRQEIWIDEHRDDLQVPIAIGVGGSFDVLARMRKDTPSWARGHGFEWLYRTIQDPGTYLKRYLTVNSWLVFQVLKEILRR
jgi:N-acetylglucosaminyldiphosphoundecaprenol N-acetyl-beta-D-mannosaminyltransferase